MSSKPIVHQTATPTTDANWRQGKPVEDPDKVKRWGFVTAKPSEYLIHVRRGKIRRRTTGQGASCFKWPWDSVAIVPTTINRLRFVADQVTLEKVGVQITGLAVYRIAEPELTFRMLNFSYTERAQEKLAEILTEMFVGATRRLVANLGLESVMTRRKESIARELMSELAPIVEGRGRTDDSTASGWGVVLDTVEVQDVRVLSESVFADMQAKFRAELALRARQAEMESAREVATLEAASARQIEEAKLASDSATRELRAQAESRTTQIELAEAEKREQLSARALEERRQREQSLALAELKAQSELAEERGQREQARQLAELRGKLQVEMERAQQAEAARLAQLARERKYAEAERQMLEAKQATAQREAELAAQLALAKAKASADRQELESAAAARVQERELQVQRLAGEVQTAIARAAREVDNLVSDDRIRMALVETGLPALAGAFAQKFGEVRFTSFGEGGDPSTMIARGIGQALALVKQVGGDLLAAAPTAPAPKDSAE